MKDLVKIPDQTTHLTVELLILLYIPDAMIPIEIKRLEEDLI